MLGVSLDRVNVLVASAVFVFVLVIYTLTKAVTLSFWDCGEFIAVSHILGVPHPPGTPLYVLIGRIFSLLPLFENIYQRVNWLSSICNAGTATFGYLIAVRLLRSAIGTGDRYSRFLVYAGSVAGALFLAFGITQWTNSVEAEVYGTTLLFLMGTLWLLLVAADHIGTPLGERISVAIVFLAVLGTGVHMTSMLIFPVLFLVLGIRRSAPDWVRYVAMAALAVLLLLIVQLSARPGEVPWQLPFLIALIVLLLYQLALNTQSRGIAIVTAGLTITALPALQAFFPFSFGVLDIVSPFTALATLGVAVYTVVQERKTAGRVSTVTLVPLTIIGTAAVLSIIGLLPLRGYDLFLLIAGVVMLSLLILLWKYLRIAHVVALLGLSTLILGVSEFKFGLAAAAIILIVGWVTRRISAAPVGLALLAIAMLGFSVQFYIPVRAVHDPIINQNEPDNWTDFVDFVERKQYGQMSMTERMFERRSEWTNQFGPHRRMGFWGFFQEQYGLTGQAFLPLLVLGILGLWQVVRRKPRSGLPLLALLLLGTVGLVLYMNFADGTRINPTTGQDYLEVRDRDYFFTPGFVVFGLAIGLGIASMIGLIRSGISSFGRGPRTVILGSLVVLFALPIYAIAENWHRCDRSRTFFAEDYAHNILASCDPNAILFVAGDNDTFPLWCLQEVGEIRRDVSVVNLSLANTRWYVKQVQTYLGLDLGLRDSQIDSLVPFRTPDGRVFRLSNQVSDRIIQNHAGRRPIHFSTSVPSNQRTYQANSIDSLLQLQGMVWSLRPDQRGRRVNVERTWSLVMDDAAGYRYRGMNDPSIFKREATMRAYSNISTTLFNLADTLRAAGSRDSAEAVVRRVIDRVPVLPEGWRYLAAMSAQAGKLAQFDSIVAIRPEAFDWREIGVFRAGAFRALQQTDSAEASLTAVLSQDPTYRPAMEDLVRFYMQMNRNNDVVRLLRQWVQANPTDGQTAEALRNLETQLRRAREAAPGNTDQ